MIPSCNLIADIDEVVSKMDLQATKLLLGKLSRLDPDLVYGALFGLPFRSSEDSLVAEVT